MKLMPFDSLFANFEKRVKKCDLPLQNYRGQWRCACGRTHDWLNESDIVCQGFFKVLIHCPDDPRFITAVTIKTGFFGMGFKGLESTGGSCLETECDRALRRKIYEGVCFYRFGIDTLPFLAAFKRSRLANRS